jgi:flagellar basal body-associated protein FliL
MSETHATKAEAEQPKAAGRGSSWLLRACVLAFMLVVILGECLVAYRYLHSDSPAASTKDDHKAEEKHGEEARAEQMPADEHGGHDKHDGHEKAKEDGHDKKEEGHNEHGAAEDHKANGEHGKKGQSPQIEADLGDFSVTIFQPASNTTLRIDFHLFGAIRVDDEGEFKSRMEEHKHRFRDQVLVTIRSSDVADLADPGLGLIKRKILAKTNETLGKPLLRSVIFSEFSFIEQ